MEIWQEKWVQVNLTKIKKICTTNTYKDMNNPTEIGKKDIELVLFQSHKEGTR